MAEDKRHQEAVRRIVNKMIRDGASPSSIGISGIQNPNLKDWAMRKGIRFDIKQKVDIIGPMEQDMGKY